MSWKSNRLPTTKGELFEEMNQFIVSRLSPEPEDPPMLSARTWSNVFGKGGSVKVEVQVNGKGVDLASVTVEDNAEARAAHESIEELIEEWNENPRASWRRAVTVAREKALEYARKQVKENQAKIDRYEAGDWR